MADATLSESRSWRTSTTLLLFTGILALFTENFLYGFVVPILPYMIEERLQLDPSYTQRLTTELLVILGFVAIPGAVIIGHFADKTSSRKIPLLVSLAGCTVGTVLVALTPSVWAVYAGRILQGISGTGAWIVGFAMITDAVGSKHTGKALGFSGSFITAGIITGPAIAGMFLDLLGYWPAWSVPLALLLVDFVARLAVVEAQAPSAPRCSPTPVQNDPNVEREETTALLEANTLLEPNTHNDTGAAEEPKQRSARGFYGVVFRQGSVYAALFNVAAFSTILSGFDATLPIHLRDAFGWSSAPIGSIFLALQIPGMLLSPFVGWLRDRIGLRWPTTLGWALTAPLLWFSGVPGPDNFLGVGAGSRGQAAFVTCIIAIGIVVSFARGAGTFQLTTTLHELREREPGIFGPGRGGSRMFALTEVSFSTGLLIGPLLCGSLADATGFYYTSCALASVSLGVATMSFAFFTHKSPTQ